MNACAGLKSTDRAAREEIFHRAYAIWEREGHPTDRQLSHWLQAETEVLGPVLGPTPSRTPMLSDTGMTGL